MNIGEFSESLKEYLRNSGYSQKELASELGLHPKVLSRKLHGSGNAHLTHMEIRAIIITLANWHTITTRDEVLHLLKEAQAEANFFSNDEWAAPPLNALASKQATPAPSERVSHTFHARQHNLPAPTTRLIGRDWALSRLQQLLGRSDIRLITLIGAGGSGKTRLALALAHNMIDVFKHGVWLVPLAGVNDPELVPVSILQALNIQATPGLDPLHSLITYLQNKQLLLILDNFEHLGEATTTVDKILAATPDLKILITSRVALRMYGEREFSVPPLDIPDPSIALAPAQLSHYGAVQLFVERAQAVLPDFALTEENTVTIAQICARVDGLPLALELAAARIRILPPAHLLERLLQARLPVLTGGARNLPSRHHTLRNTVTWSYNLLSPAEQTWFARLGIFTGSWSLEAAEAMMQQRATDQELSPVDMLEQLVSNSLIVRMPADHKQVRFTMLETLREYALEQLANQGELEQLHDWHACYYLREAEEGERGLRGPQQLIWLAQLGADRDNFRAALDWSLQRARHGMKIHASSSQQQSEDHVLVAGSKILSTRGAIRDGLFALELSLRLASALRPYWEWQGYLTEARYWLVTALSLSLEEETEQTVFAARAKALSEASRLTSLENNQTRAIEQAEESMMLWRRLHDPNGLAGALLHRAWAAHATADYETARMACQEGLHYLEQADDPWLYTQLIFYLGAAAGFTGEFDHMRTLYEQSRELFEQMGDRSAVADVLKDHGAMILLESKFNESIDLLTRSMQLCYQLDHKQYMTTGLCWLSIAVGLRGEPDMHQASIDAARLKGAATTLMEMTGFTSWAKTNPFIQAVEESIRTRIDEDSWNTAWDAGRAWSIEQAIDFACKLGD